MNKISHKTCLRGTWRGLIVSEGGVAVAVVVTSGGVDVEVRVKD